MKWGGLPKRRADSSRNRGIFFKVKIIKKKRLVYKKFKNVNNIFQILKNVSQILVVYLRYCIAMVS